MRLFLATLAATGVFVSTAHATDVLVWEQHEKGHRTFWVTVDGDGAKVVATRDEAVTAPDGEHLVALRPKTVQRTVVPCEALEEEEPTAEAHTSKIDWPGLAAVPLDGGAEWWLVDPNPSSDSDQIWGDTWNEAITLTGGAGPLVMFYHAHSGYSCGAHGFVEDNAVTVDLTKKEGVAPGDLLVDARKTGAKPTAALFERATKEGCVDVGDESFIYLDGLTIGAGKGELVASLTYIYPTEAEWAFNCTLDEEATIGWDEVVPALRPSRDVARAVAAAKVGGTVGWSLVTLSGTARDEALKRFGTAAPAAPKRNRATAEAQKLIEQGRKLTKSKDYAQAIAAFDAAIAKDRDAARAWSGRGYARMLAGQLLEASRDFDHALGLDETAEFQGAVWYNIGQIAEQRGKPNEARAAYQRSLKVRPSKAVKKALDKLKR
ncbi:MAG: tetratricopeptide repeat protein [Deltaproteobacteria bacterium]|nr:MAG: tetratricopeptide repeat protein [Deltaproteobacteria bacterium]